MKTTKIISACAVLVALASCSNDHVISQPGAEDTPIRIQANVGAVTTKAAYNLLESAFGSGDAINVYITENTSNNSGTTSGASYTGMVYTHDGSKFAPTTTQFFPANGNGIDVWGVYPSTVNESSTSQDFSIKEDQTSDADYKASDLMFASKLSNQDKNSSINLTFAHKLSKIIVKLQKEPGVDADLTGAKIKLTEVIKKATLTSVNNSGIVLGTLSSDPGDKIVLKIGEYNINGTAAIVIPQSTTGMKFNVELATGGTYSANIPNAPAEFAENTVYTYTLTLKANGINISAQINPWTAGTDGSGDATLQ